MALPFRAITSTVKPPRNFNFSRDNRCRLDVDRRASCFNREKYFSRFSNRRNREDNFYYRSYYDASRSISILAKLKLHATFISIEISSEYRRTVTFVVRICKFRKTNIRCLHVSMNSNFITYPNREISRLQREVLIATISSRINLPSTSSTNQRKKKKERQIFLG